MLKLRKPQKKPVTQKQVAVAEQTATLEDVRVAVESDAIDYEMTNERIKILESYKKSLRPEVEKAVAQFGIPDANGHKHLELDGVELIHEKRTSAGFNSVVAEEILRKKNLLETIGQKVLIERWELDEEKLYNAYEAGMITPEELDQMFNETVSWALKVKIDERKIPDYAELKRIRKPSKEDMPYVTSEE